MGYGARSRAAHLNEFAQSQIMPVVSSDHFTYAAARDALVASEAKFRSLFEQNAVGIAHSDLNGRWLDVNQRLSDMLGYTRSELVELGWQAITFGPDSDTTDQLREHFAAPASGPLQIAKRYVRKDGTLVWVSISVAPQRDPAGNIAGFTACIEDISDRKLAELERERLLRELYRERSELQAVIGNVSDGIVVVEPTGAVVHINSAALAIFGFAGETPGENAVTDVSLIRIAAPDGAELAESEWPAAKASRGESFRDFEVVVERVDKVHRVLAAFTATPVLDDSGKIILGVITVRDITSSRKAKQQLERAYAREHRIAESLQRSLLLMSADHEVAGFEVCPVYWAAWDEAAVGGDFYDAIPLSATRIALVVGDISGRVSRPRRVPQRSSSRCGPT